MQFKMKCPHCEKSLKVNEGLAGRKAKCPYCKGSVLVTLPAPSTPASAPAPTPTPAQPEPTVFDSLDPLDTQPSQPTEPTPVDSSPTDAAPEKPAPAATPSPTPTTPRGGSEKWTDGSNVSLVTTGIFAAVLTGVTYAILYPLSSFYVAQLFTERGWVPIALVFLFSWCLSILIFKSRKMARQKQSMLLDVLPAEISDEITAATLDKYVEHIHGLPSKPGESYLLNRVLRGLEHFRVRKSTPETVTMMTSQSEIDANNVASSYTLLKVFIWAIPIMGFIGTVIGIGGAVAGFAGSLEGSSDISTLKESLNSVTGGLATAFDTTLIALVMSIIIKFPTSSMQKSEEGLINWVDEYCNETLLRRLNDGREGGAVRGKVGAIDLDPGVFKQVVETALAGHQAELEHWVIRLKKIGSTVTTQVSEGWEEINTKMVEQLEAGVLRVQQHYQEQTTQFQQLQQAQAQELQQTQNATAQQLLETQTATAQQLLQQHQTQAQQQQQLLQDYATQLQQKLDERATQLEHSQFDQVERIQQQIANMTSVAEQLQQTLAGLAGQTEALQNQVLATVDGSRETLDDHFTGLERGLTSLSGVLERLGEQQVVVQQVEAPKRGWFRRSNGSAKN